MAMQWKMYYAVYCKNCLQLVITQYKYADEFLSKPDQQYLDVGTLVLPQMGITAYFLGALKKLTC